MGIRSSFDVGDDTLYAESSQRPDCGCSSGYVFLGGGGFEIIFGEFRGGDEDCRSAAGFFFLSSAL